MRNSTIIIAIVFCTVIACGGSGEGNSEESGLSGKELFLTHCAICHGENGRKGFAGAKILPDSELALEGRIQLITHGKGTMMPYEGVLKPEEIKRVAEYTLSLK